MQAQGFLHQQVLLIKGERFHRYFGDFEEKYGFKDMYSGGFYPFSSLEEYWAYWSRYIYINRYMDAPKPVYKELLKLVKDKDYFVITTNVDHCFQKAGFDKHRLFYIQGDYVPGILTETHCRQLADCYHSCLELASRNRLKSIAFYCISTGEFHFPQKKASGIAVQAVTEFLQTDAQIEKVIFNVFKEEDYSIYKIILHI